MSRRFTPLPDGAMPGPLPAREDLMTEQETRDEICRRLIEGESLRAICRSEGMPSKSTVCRWLGLDETFQAQYAAARIMQADALADETLDIADDATNDWMARQRREGDQERVLDSEHVQRSKLRIDARKWLAGKLAPKKYGDAALIKHADAHGDQLGAMSTQEMAIRLAAIMAAAAERNGK